MQAQIKEIYSSDIDDLSSFVPENEKSFSFSLRLIIGPQGEAGEESFDIEVCTPDWLLEEYDQDEIILGKHRVIVFKYDYEKLVSKLTLWVQFCNGADWQEISTKLSRIGHWEFEDYIE